MAVLNQNSEKIYGVLLPYKKIGFVGIHDESVSINIDHKLSQEYLPLFIDDISLTLDESAELSETLRKIIYEFIKSKGLISGLDC